MDKEKQIEKYNVNGDLIIKGPINGNLTIYVDSCQKVLVKGEISGDTNLNINEMGDNASIDQSSVIKKYYILGIIKWFKGLFN